MAPDLRGRDQFERAYRAIRSRLVSGEAASGERLSVNQLVTTLKLSPTPIREALSRLVGEGLIEDRRGNGYYMPSLDADEIAGLYRLRGLSLIGLLPQGARGERVMRHAAGLIAKPGHDAGPTEAVFIAIARSSDDLVLMRTASLAADRLILAIRAEPMVMGSKPSDVGVFQALLKSGTATSLRAAIRRYHDRRVRASPALAAAMARRSRAGPPI